jgi:DNA topoisomerase I
VRSTTPGREANRARLHHATDQRPGISRHRSGRGFSYRRPDGSRVGDRAERARIRSLAIPPAWTDVWICPDPDGHLQATGRDARGRKQYRYHPRWRRRRDADKFARMAAFARALPRIRRACDADLARPGLPREKVLAAVIRLLELTLIRVGNEEYARLNRSFGLTTLRDRHATVQGSAVRFRFRGKSGRVHEVDLRDRRLASLISRCQRLPGQELFQYVDDDGAVHDVTSTDVNDYLRDIAGDDFTAKDFRTWAGTVLAYRALRSVDPAVDGRARRRNVVRAVEATAAGLGNTPAVARSSYVHPAVIDAYLDGRLGGAAVRSSETTAAPPSSASPAEMRGLLRLLDRSLAADARRSTGGRDRDRQPRPRRLATR